MAPTDMRCATATHWRAPHLEDLLLRLFIDFYRRHRLLHVAQHHVEMLVVGLAASLSRERANKDGWPYVKLALELAIAAHLHEDPLVQRQPNEVQRLLHCAALLG